MFDIVLGTQVVETSGKKWVIGKVLLDEKTNNLKIMNPIGLDSKSISSTSDKQEFKLSLYTISEFSSGISIIIPNGRWANITSPTNNLLKEYNKVNLSMQEVRDYDSINMDEIADSINETKDMPSDEVMDTVEDFLKHFFGKIGEQLSEEEPYEQETKKISWSRKRWLDNLE